MRPAHSRRWTIGSRFYLNRWNAAYPEPLMFEVTRVTKDYLYFWNRQWDTEGPRARKMPRARMARLVSRREIVRVF